MKIAFDKNGYKTEFENKQDLFNYLEQTGAFTDMDNIPNTEKGITVERLIEIYFNGNGNTICTAGGKKYGMKHHKLLLLKK